MTDKTKDLAGPGTGITMLFSIVAVFVLLCEAGPAAQKKLRLTIWPGALPL